MLVRAVLTAGSRTATFLPVSPAWKMAHTLVAANGSVPELLKVLASAHLVGQKVAVSVDASLPSAIQLRTADGSRITDSSAAALFLASAGSAAAPGLPVEDWLAWDTRVLVPAVRKVMSQAGPAPAAEAVVAAINSAALAAVEHAGARPAGAAPSAVVATYTDLVSAVQHVDRALAAAQPAGSAAPAAGLVGGKLSLADVAVTADLVPAVNSGKFPLHAVSPAVFAHVAAIAAQPFFQAAAAQAASVAPKAAPAAATSAAAAAPVAAAADQLSGSKRKHDGTPATAPAAAAAVPAAAGAGAPAAAGAGAAAAGAGGAAEAAASKKAAKAAAKKEAAAAAEGDAKYSKADVAKGLDVSALTSGVEVDVTDDALMLTPVAEQLKSLFTTALHAAFPLAKEAGLEADVVTQASVKFFHQYQCNSAVQLVGRLKGKPGAPANPRAAAEAILAALATLPKSALIGKLEVSGPGFINIYVAVNYLSARVNDLLARGLRPLPPARKLKVAVDYSSPNIAKEMHIGHLRSTILGDTMARILEFCGHEVARINHVGDWGTQFGMLIAHLKDMRAAGESTEGGIGDITNFYKAAKKRFDADPDFKDRAHKEVVALQSGDADNKAMWQKMIDVSQATYDEVYRRLDVDKRLQLFGESQYNSMIPAVLAELEAKGLLQLSDGALIFPVPGEEIPLMVRKRDGGVGYDSTDLAAIHYRLHSLKMDWIVYVVDAGQSLHFDLVFKGAQIAGWYRPLPAGADYAPAEALTADAVAAAEGGAKPLWSADAKPALVMHTGFGVIQGEDRKKFKTRSGDTVRLVDVLDEAKERAKTALRDRIASGNTPVVADDAAIERTASVLGYGGVKYFDLRQHRTTDYIFNYDRMLSPDGDTAVYLEYAHARLCSILRKARESGVDVDGILASAGAEGVRFTHPTETALITELLRFPEVMRRTTAALTPHLLCEFVYAVANRTAEFHRDCHVLGTSTPPEVRAARLRMVAAVQLVIAETLRILGITPLDRI